MCVPSPRLRFACCMSGDHHLNGSDYLMLGFDHELRRRGYMGNSCQIALELGAAVSADGLRQRLDFLTDHHPVLRAHPGGVVFPRWKSSGRTAIRPQVRLHQHEPGLSQRLFNEPLNTRRGELVRFDLMERDGGRMTLLFTWAHALMDAPGAEHFLSVVGDEELSLSPPASASAPSGWGKQSRSGRVALAWKYLHHLDQFCQAAPRSMGLRHPGAPARFQHHTEKFSPAETECIRANGVRLCGILGDAQYHAAVALVELHRLRQRLDCPTPSYVLAVPVGLRPKGGIEPVFGNQLTMMMMQFLPGQLDSVGSAVASGQDQTARLMRAGLLESGVALAELFRFLPLPVYMALVKQGLRGEICSLFYGDTAAVNPRLTTFRGVTVDDFTHVAAVTPSPGLGVIFYYFRGELHVTVVHSLQVLQEAEAAGFGAGLRARLLQP